MPLAKGTRLGPYEILAPLGEGGMGAVYKARDTRLDRTVAIKVSTTQFGERFEREARAVAALNHPHICTLYDIGPDYLVMEYVEGKTLAGPLALDEALRLGAQIAEALDAAHRGGIIHRDLKPGNILVTKAGVKLLDFGLAKMAESEPIGDETRTKMLTQEGAVLGTPQYMPPEQIEGRPADSRSDIFAFGTVLYEMVTGKRAFEGRNKASVMAAILTAEPPPVSSVQPVTPAALDRVVKRCLAKDPDERWQSARDLAAELQWIAQARPDAPPATAGPPLITRSRVALVALVLVVAAFGAGMFWKSFRDDAPVSWTGTMVGGPTIALGPRVSPDGQMLALQAMVDGLTQVAVMKPETGNWTVLTHSKQRGQVKEISWSPDGTKLYFGRDDGRPRGIFSVPVLGGEERLVLEDAALPEVMPDGSLMVSRINAERQIQVHRFWPESGRIEALPAELYRTATAALRVFPDGREVAFLGRPLSGAPENHLYALDLASGKSRRLLPAGDMPIVADLFPIAVTPDGQAVLINLPAGNLNRIVAVPRDGSGRIRPLLTLTLVPWYIDTAPDGSIYLEQVHQPIEVLRFPAAGGRAEHLSRSSAFQFGSITELPGGRVLIAAALAGRSRMVVAQAGREATPLLDTIEETAGPATMVGDRHVAFLVGPAAQRVIGIASLESGRVVRRLKGPQGSIDSLASSPDGKTIYYVAAKMVWAIPAEDGTPAKIGPGDSVVVRPDGRELIVQLNENAGSRLVRRPVAGGPDVGIPIEGDLRLTAMPLSPNAAGKDGRILAQVASPDAWHWRPAILDPASGQVKKISVDYEGDVFFSGWSKDGQVVALGIGIQGGIWRLRPEAGK